MMNPKFKKYFIAFYAFIILVVFCTGNAFSKYRESIQLNTVNVSISSGKLVEAFELFEHKAIQDSTGAYSLSSEVVLQNTYYLVPGITIPKDPYLVITGKSEVSAYLYVEILDNSNSLFSYEISNRFKEMNVNGMHGGKVYVYTNGTGNAIAIKEDFNSNPVYILKDNQVQVLRKERGSFGNVSLSFYGYLAQASLGNSPEDVFTTCFGGE